MAEETNTVVTTEPTAQPQEPQAVEPTATEPTQATTEPTQTTEPVKTEDLEGSNKNPDKGSDEEPKPSTPEVVKDDAQFKLPDGMKLDEGKMKSFISLAKEFKLTQEQAQKLVDFDAAGIKASEEAFRKMQEGWKADTLKELGENAEQKLGEAVQAYKQFGDDEFVKLMKDTGLENHPAVVRVFRNIGSKIATDKTVPATSNGVKSSKTVQEILYGN